jgi:2-hydroxychromene-2-carboxylate isomerase
MRYVDWYFDFISPFAYLQWCCRDRLPAAVEMRPVPVLLAGLLGHWGSKGPAEVPPKRQFTYRYTLWLSRRHNIPFKMPPAHPFNPLKALRLAIALDARPAAIDAIFTYLWRDGRALDDEVAWNGLLDNLGVDVARRIDEAPAVKSRLRQNTGDAVARGVFGVPTFAVGEELFWGFDATDMLLHYVQDPDAFGDPEMYRVGHLPEGVQR